MSRVTTNMDMQRITFVESLHNSLKKQAAQAIADHKKFITIASSYIEDGLQETECVELLMIDGLSRDAAESYTAMAINKQAEATDSLDEYSFQFEDENGIIWSSHDIGKTVRASNDDEAWTMAEEALEDLDKDAQKIISVSRI